MRLSLGLIVAVLGAAALGIPFGGRSATSRTVAVRVSVRGSGLVEVGALRCRSRCTWRFPRGSVRRFRALPSLGQRFSSWRGRCTSRRPACTVTLRNGGALIGTFAPIAALVSWSAHVHCKPLRTEIPEILGSQEGPEHGATEDGGRFQPHLRGLAQQHLLDPPCTVEGTPTFVEVDDVVITTMPNRSGDADDSLNLTQTRPDIANPYMKTLHAEIDGTWIVAGVNPPLWPAALGTRLDVQGFVYWDISHVHDAWHQYSGWELHPVAAWRTVR